MKQKSPEEPSFFIIRTNGAEHKMYFLKRDWAILHGEARVLTSSSGFIEATKAHDGFTVAKGGSSQLVYEVSQMDFMTRLLLLKKQVANRISLLQFDYALELKSKSSGEVVSIGGFCYLGYRASAWAKFKGFCVLDLYEVGDVNSMRPVGFIDISSKTLIETDEDGPLVIHRIKRKSILMDSLESAFAFLQSNPSSILEIEYLK